MLATDERGVVALVPYAHHHSLLSPHFSTHARPLSVYPRLQYLIWRIYYAKLQSNYYYHFDKFLVFAHQHLKGEALKAVEHFKQKRAELIQGLFHPGCHRVSTMLARCLYMGREFHGHRVSAHLLVRSWALLHNFQPYCPRACLRTGSPFTSPFHKQNGMTYRTNWLENRF